MMDKRTDPKFPDEGVSDPSSDDAEENGAKVALFDLGLEVIEALSGDNGGLPSD